MQDCCCREKQKMHFVRNAFKVTVPSTLHRWGGDAVNPGVEVDLADTRETNLADYQVYSALQTNPCVCVFPSPTQNISIQPYLTAGTN